MPDKIKLIENFVENLKNNANTIPSLGINGLTGYLLACNDIITYISSIQSDCEKKDYHKRYENIAQSDYFKSAYSNKSLGKEEHASKDLELEEEVTRYYKSLGIIENAGETYEWDDMISNTILTARHFAEWQKLKDLKDSLESDITILSKFYEKGKVDAIKEIMKEAVETTVHNCQVDGITIDGVEIFPDGLTLDDKIYKDGDKIKLIIVKNEQQ